MLYLVFNEGYSTTSGTEALRVELTSEAIRLTREVRRLLPGNGEVAGLLALIPLAEQDRSRWNARQITEGIGLVTTSLSGSPVGSFQIQAAIAAIHDEATTAGDTDWPQILALYDLLARTSTNPVVALNRAVAAAMVHDPQAGLDLIAGLDHDRHLASQHRLHAVRAHRHEQAGDLAAAHAGFEEAARRATNIPEQRYLRAQAARLASTR